VSHRPSHAVSVLRVQEDIPVRTVRRLSRPPARHTRSDAARPPDPPSRTESGSQLQPTRRGRGFSASTADGPHPEPTRTPGAFRAAVRELATGHRRVRRKATGHQSRRDAAADGGTGQPGSGAVSPSTGSSTRMHPCMTCLAGRCPNCARASRSDLASEWVPPGRSRACAGSAGGRLWFRTSKN